MNDTGQEKENVAAIVAILISSSSSSLPFVFRAHVHAPFDLVLHEGHLAILHLLLQDFNGLGVGQAGEWFRQHVFQTRPQVGVPALDLQLGTSKQRKKAKKRKGEN